MIWKRAYFVKKKRLRTGGRALSLYPGMNPTITQPIKSSYTMSPRFPILTFPTYEGRAKATTAKYKALVS